MNKTIQIAVDIVQGANFASGMKAIDLISSGIEKAASAIKDAAVESIKLAANFEETRKSAEVFAGGASLARKELQLVENLARNTVGLRLESAEQGYLRLRNLGFQAETTRNLIAGISKERILSRADEGAVNRVVTNFQQISRSTSRFGQDFNEIIRAMPTMTSAFEKAFGTLDRGKLKKIFEANPEEAFNKLSKAMAQTQTASGGLNDAIAKNADTWIELGRAFGEPLLPELTTDINAMSTALYSNRGVVAEWGNYFADVMRGARSEVTELNKELGKPKNQQDFLAKNINVWKEGLSDIAGFLYKYTNPIGIIQNGFLDNLANEGESKRPFEGEASALKRFGGFGKQQDEESLKILRAQQEQGLSVLSNSYRVREALLGSHLAYTKEQELSNLQETSKAKSDAIKREIDFQKYSYAQQLKVVEDDDEKTAQITAKRNEALSKLNTDFIINEIESQKKARDLKRQIEEQKRKDSIDLLQTSVKESRSIYDNQLFDIERALSQQGVSVKDGYAQITRLTDAAFNETLKATRQSNSLQLQNLSLTNEQRQNLIRQGLLEERSLSEQHRRDLLEIQDKQYQDELKRIDQHTEAVKQKLQSAVDLYSSIGGGISSQNINDRFVKNLGMTFFGGDYDNLLSAAYAKKSILESSVRSGNAELSDARRNKLPKETLDLYQKQLDKVNGEYSHQIDILKILENGYSQFEIQFYRTVKGYNAGTTSIREFQKAQLELFNAETQAKVDQYEADQSAVLKASQDAAAVGKLGDAKKFTQEWDKLSNEKTAYIFNRSNEAAAKYRETLDGLSETIADLRSGKSDRFLNDFFGGEKLKEQVAQLTEIKRLEYDLAHISDNTAERYRLTWLRAIYDVKDANIRAVESQIESQVKLADATTLHVEQLKAKVLGHLAEQKTLTDAFADGINSAFDKVANYADKKLGKLAEIPILGDLAKFGNRQVLSNLTRGIMDKISPDFSAKAERFENPLLAETKDQTKLLAQIAANTGGLPSGVSGSGGLNSIKSNLPAIFGGGNLNNRTGINSPLVMNYGDNSEVNKTLASIGLPPILGGDSGASSGGLFGGLFGQRKNPFTNKLGSKSAGIAGGIGDIASMFGGMIGGRAGNTISYAGKGASLGANFGIWGAAIGAGAGALFGLLGGGGNPLKKLHDAAQSAYSLDIKDKSILATLKDIGDSHFGNASKHAPETVRLEDSKELLREYSKQIGVTNSALGTSIKDLQDPNFSSNRFVSKFGGMRAFGGPVSAGFSYIVGEKRPELFTPNVSGTISPSVNGNSNEMRMLATAIGELREGFQMLVGKLAAMSPNDVVRVADDEIIGNKVLNHSSSSGSFGDRLRTNLGVA